MAAPTRNRQPRPLSIIGESSLDDDLGSDFQSDCTGRDVKSDCTGSDVKGDCTGRNFQRNCTRSDIQSNCPENGIQSACLESENKSQLKRHCLENLSQRGISEYNVKSTSTEMPTRQRNGRRIAVAPLQHPAVAMSRDDPNAALSQFQASCKDNATDQIKVPGREVVPCKGIMDTSGKCRDVCYNPASSVQNANTYSKNGRSLTVRNWKCDLVSLPYLRDQFRHYLPERSTEQFSYEQSSNCADSVLTITRDGHLLTDKQNSSDCGKYHNGNDKVNPHDMTRTTENSVKCEKSKAATIDVSDTKCKKNVESVRVGEKEQLDKEQQAWKNRVRKSASFNSSSAKFRPLRRTRSNLDSKKSSSTVSYGQVCIKKDEGISSEMAENKRPRFYLSSDFKVDHEKEQYLIQKHIRKNKASTDLTSSDVLQTDPGKVSHSVNEPKERAVRRISAIDQSDFSLLKDTATRLNLPTRRPSTTDWKAAYLDSTFGQRQWDSNRAYNEYETLDYDKDGWSYRDNSLTVDDRNRINQSLSWLRQELIGIRLQDQALARQFLGIRHKMNKLRLDVQCQDHMKLLDEAGEDIEEVRELSRLVDVAPEMMPPLTSLQHVGVTKMNLVARRFSTC